MAVAEYLQNEKKRIKHEISVLETDLRDIDIALDAIAKGGDSHDKPTSAQVNAKVRHSMPVDDAIVRAVEAGRTTPATVLEYLGKGLGVHTTINSVRTRLSRLKSDGRIGHDGSGWIPVKENGEAEASPETGEVTASPNENRETVNDLLG